MHLKEQDFGEAFATGLRKGLDSDWSALAMHVAKLLPPEVWASYCRWANEKIKAWDQRPTLEQVSELFLLDGWNPPNRSGVMAWRLVLRRATICDARNMRAWIDQGIND